MKRIGFLSAILIAALAFGMTLSACSKPADDEIAKAEDAIKHAGEQGAEGASPRLYEKAKDLLAEAKRANDAGNYSEARKKAEFALMRAEQAGKNAEKLGGTKREKPGEGGE